MNLNKNYTGKTKLKEWWGIVKANFQTIEDDFNGEVSTRISADNALSTRINNEANSRAAADTTLQQNINSEANSRAAADNTLQGNIESEANRRTAADTTLQGNIESEASARATADNTLQAQIDSIKDVNTVEDLYGEPMYHIVELITSETLPTPYWLGREQYMSGDIMHLDFALTNVFYIDGVQIEGTYRVLPTIDTRVTTYFIVHYDMAENTWEVEASSSAVTSEIVGDVWTFTLCSYGNFVIEATAEENPYTDTTYELRSYNAQFYNNNESTATGVYSTSKQYAPYYRTREDLHTVNKDSFLDAVNEIMSITGVLGIKNMGFKSRDLPDPYVARNNYNSEYPCVDIDFTGAFSVNGTSCGTMDVAHIDVTAPYQTNIYIVVHFNIDTYEISVESSSTVVENTLSGNIWTFTYGFYQGCDLSTDDDDPDSPTYGQTIIWWGGVSDWSIEVSRDKIGEYGHTERVYDSKATQIAAMQDTLGSLSASLDSVNGVS